ncbi:643_t:CDS:2, partial [Funneliformis caledonium]
MPSDYPICGGIKFISPKAGDEKINHQKIEVVWETNSYTEVNGLDLYNENGNFVESFWEEIKLTEKDGKVSGKFRLRVPSNTKLPDKFTFKILGKGDDNMPCSTLSENLSNNFGSLLGSEFEYNVIIDVGNGADHKEFHAHSV